MYVMNAVVAFARLLTVSVVSACGDVIQATPCVRNLIVADIDGLIRDMIGLMDEQVQAIDAIATELRVELISVATRIVERILFDEGTALVVLPYIRCIHIGDMNGRVMEVTRIDIQTQCDDAVATMDSAQCIVIQTDVTNEAWFVSLGQTPT